MRSKAKSKAALRRAAVGLMRGLRPVEQQYVRDLRGVMAAITKEWVRRLEPHLGEIARADGADTLNPLSNLLKTTEAEIHAAIGPTVGPLFNRMGSNVAKVNAKGMGLFGIKARDARLGPLVDSSRDQNIKLIENAHRVYAAQVREVIGDPDNFGLRVEDLKAKLLERGDVSGSRAELIARDQTLKLNANISQARQVVAGVEQYTWSTSLDERVREEHQALEGQVFDWINAPEPGHPGQDFQCRCVAVPVGVEELDQIFG